MIFHASEAAAYEAPGDAKRVVRYLVDPERTELRHFMAGLTTLEPGQKTGVARHEAEELYFILEGHALMRLGELEQAVGPETVIVIASNVSHQIVAEGERVRYLWTLAPQPPAIKAKGVWQRVG